MTRQIRERTRFEHASLPYARANSAQRSRIMDWPPANLLPLSNSSEISLKIIYGFRNFFERGIEENICRSLVEWREKWEDINRGYHFRVDSLDEVHSWPIIGDPCKPLARLLSFASPFFLLLPLSMADRCTRARARFAMTNGRHRKSLTN